MNKTCPHCGKPVWLSGVPPLPIRDAERTLWHFLCYEKLHTPNTTERHGKVSDLYAEDGE